MQKYILSREQELFLIKYNPLMLPDVDAVRRAFTKKYQEKLAVEI